MLATCREGSASKTITSSRYAATRSRPLMTSLMTLTNHPGAALLPCGITSYSKRRVSVQKAVSGIVPLCTVIW